MSTNVKQISFLKYNNYANRTTHPGDSWNDIFGAYSSLTGRYANEIARINEPKLWNPNDGITTSIVTPNGVDFSTEPDYLVVWWTEHSEIESRWFITETVRLHQGQYQCYLRRDVFAEAWDELMSATCHIDRAILNKYNSLIFNPEPTTVNQIINQEILINDKTGCPWIVFYGDQSPTPVTVPPDPGTYDLTTTLSAAAYESAYDKLYIKNNDDLTAVFRYKTNATDAPQRKISLNAYAPDIAHNPYYISDNVPSTNTADRTRITFPNTEKLLDARSRIQNAQSKLVAAWPNAHPTQPNLCTAADYASLLGKVGKRIYSSADNKIYEISLDVVGDPDKVFGVWGVNDSWYDDLSEILVSDDTHGLLVEDLTILTENVHVSSWYDRRSTAWFILATRFKPRLTSISANVGAQATPPETMKPLDAPYFAWCMPYGNVKINYYDGNADTYLTTDKELNLRAAVELSRANSSNKTYDFQILPYCPLPDSLINNDGSITVPKTGNLVNITDLTSLTDNNTPAHPLGFIFTIPYTTFRRNIMLSTPITIDDPKVDLLTRSYRLYAPNYSSSFEFSIAKNGGLTGFTVSCTYMPTQPYIRVAPIWGGLYGDQFFADDPRGLICQGDYSLARLNDAWVQFQEQNKNFQSIFSRQIDNMDVMRNIQVEQERWGVAAGVLQGITGGAVAGSAAGAYGALAGGIAGGIGAGITGARDLELSKKAFAENKSYATDIHNLQLGNVQAMPRTLSRTTAFNVDNRYFPILTVYNCTEQEFVSILSFIRERSMNVGVYGRFEDVINNSWTYTSDYGTYTDRGFIQGSIIHIDTIHDSHFVDALNDEITKGVYTK